MPRKALPDGPFLRSHAHRVGLTPWDLRRRCRPVLRGVYVGAETPLDLEVRSRAALLLAPPGSFLSHHTAAALLGGVVPDHADVHVTSAESRVKTTGVAAHRRKPDQQLITWRNLPVTSAGQTFLDLAPFLDLVDLVILGDSLVRAGRTTPEALVSLAAEARGPFSRLARRAAGLVRSGVDSPMETRLRLLMVLAGLPEPEVDHRVLDEHGRLVRRYDLCYRAFRVIIEYDGRQHAESLEQWRRDIERDEDLDNEQVRRLVIVASDIYRTPARTLRRIVRAMGQQGMTVPRLSDEWRRHFPSRPGDLEAPI